MKTQAISYSNSKKIVKFGPQKTSSEYALFQKIENDYSWVTKRF
jgi:hypothetical protein